MLLNAAGTRPEPAVSLPSENGTSPRATTEAEPELDPPLTYSGLKLLATAPCGDRVPTSPVANWSKFVLPTTMAPAARKRATTGASHSATYEYAGHAAVVGQPATSMMSLTAKGTP